MVACQFEFRLTLEVVLAAEGEVPSSASRAYAVPSRPCSLVRRGPGYPEIVLCGAGPVTDVVALLPLAQRPHGPRLLALAAAAGELRVNGQPAPQLVVLKENDFVQWGTAVAFNVAVFRRTEVGPPPVEWLGRPCPVCRVAFAPLDRTLGCACGTRLHCEESNDKLQCAQLRRDCPACHKPLLLPLGQDALPA